MMALSNDPTGAQTPAARRTNRPHGCQIGREQSKRGGGSRCRVRKRHPGSRYLPATNDICCAKRVRATIDIGTPSPWCTSVPRFLRAPAQDALHKRKPDSQTVKVANRAPRSHSSRAPERHVRRLNPAGASLRWRNPSSPSALGVASGHGGDATAARREPSRSYDSILRARTGRAALSCIRVCTFMLTFLRSLTRVRDTGLGGGCTL